MQLLVFSTLAAIVVEAGIVHIPAAQVIGRATTGTTAHTSYKTTADDPVQTGFISNCNKFYDVVTGDSCATVEAAFGITDDEFLAWNPAVSSDCETNFWVGDSYCVGTAAVVVSTTSSSAPHTTIHTTADLPTQSGTICNCNEWYDVVTGDTCATIESVFNITSDEFLTWNPAVSSDCDTNFWVGDSYCVGTTSAACVSSTSTAPHTAALTAPDDPTQTGTISTCNKWYDIVTGDTCTSVETAFNITHADFLYWNPAVSSDCGTNFWVGDSYCVGNNTSTVSSTYSILSQPSSSYVPATITTATSFPPSQTQTGQVSYCNRWQFVYAGDTCNSIQARYSGSMTLDNLLAWNPALGTDCAGLYANYYVCVGIQLQTSAINTTTVTSFYYPSYTSTTATTLNTTFVASPTQSGLAASCLAFYQATDTDTCESIVSTEGYVTLDELEDYNPALGSDCSGLVAGDYYCVMNGTLPLPSVATVAPTATQTGIVSTCVSWYLADSGDTCTLILEMFGTFSESDFLSWNPSVGSDCSGLVVGDYYCVSIPSTPTTRTSTYISTSLPTNGVGPQPEQTGIPDDCESYWFVGTSDTCDTITDINNITVTEFTSWNPAIGSDCSGLIADYYVCVGMNSAITTTTTSSAATSSDPSAFTATGSVSTPSPVQTSMVSDCERFYYVESGDGCYDLAADADIALADFYSYNPAISTDCSGLQASVYVCIGLGGPATTITSGTPVPGTSTAAATTTVALATPTPTQTGMVDDCVRFYYVESGDGCYDIATDAGVALSDFYSWNTALNGDCTGLEAGVYVCIGLTGTATTIASGTPVPTS